MSDYLNPRAYKAIIKWYAPRQVWVCIDNLTRERGVFVSVNLPAIYDELKQRSALRLVHDTARHMGRRTIE